MTIQELIEFAVLDVLGLLDDDERKAYERSFAACAPAVQAMVRREQTRLSNIDRLLPKVDAPVHLRAQVLEAVRRSMEADEVGLADVLGPWSPPEMIEGRRVSRLWRSTALASIAAAFVLGATTLWLKGRFHDVGNLLRDNELSDQTLLAMSPKFHDWFFSDEEKVTQVNFREDAAFTSGKARLFLDHEGARAYLVCRNLPSTDGRPYTLVVVNEDGRPGHTLATFRSDGRLTEFEVANVVIQSGARLAILAPAETGSGQRVLSTRPVPQT